MNFTEHEKNMIVISLRNEGKRFQKFADELLRGYPYMEGATKEMAKERIIEYAEVVQEYEELMMKVSVELLTSEE
jgi:uncharacterized Fe-S cluster-containing MiaB family protein